MTFLYYLLLLLTIIALSIIFIAIVIISAPFILIYAVCNFIIGRISYYIEMIAIEIQDVEAKQN